MSLQSLRALAASEHREVRSFSVDGRVANPQLIKFMLPPFEVSITISTSILEKQRRYGTFPLKTISARGTKPSQHHNLTYNFGVFAQVELFVRCFCNTYSCFVVFPLINTSETRLLRAKVFVYIRAFWENCQMRARAASSSVTKRHLTCTRSNEASNFATNLIFFHCVFIQLGLILEIGFSVKKDSNNTTFICLNVAVHKQIN